VLLLSKTFVKIGGLTRTAVGDRVGGFYINDMDREGLFPCLLPSVPVTVLYEDRRAVLVTRAITGYGRM
jgi:hypothetical protein